MFFTDGRFVLPLLLIGHPCCFLLICFKHSPGLQSWAALPLINGLATFWLLARAQTQFLNWNE
jgi:antibiotic biosynthesis monooxygenase (ABM) superfamily enzyme